MNRPAVSATQWIFGREELERTADRLGRLGYDGIELSGEPDELAPRTVEATLALTGLTVTSICGIYTPERDLSHPSSTVREGAVEYLRRCVELGGALGARAVIVVPTAVGRVRAEADPRTELAFAAESIAHVADEIPAAGPQLVIEALNRYETSLVTTLAAADELRRLCASDRVGLMADLFHMNIEEASIDAAIRRHGQHIAHVHLADSNRRPPGLGHTDFAAVVAALEGVGYDGCLTMEFLPATASPYLAASLDVAEAEKEEAARLALAHVDEVLDGR